MALPVIKPLTYLEYLDIEHQTGVRHEFIEGVATAMAGGTIRHSALKTRLAQHMGNALRAGPCQPFDADCKVRSLEGDFATYPDMSVVCGAIETHPGDVNAVANPTLLVEVLSKTTEAYDRGDKFAYYRKIATLQHYLLISSSTERLEHYARQADGSWSLREYGPQSTLVIAELDLALVVDDLYRDLPPEPVVEPQDDQR